VKNYSPDIVSYMETVTSVAERLACTNQKLREFYHLGQLWEAPSGAGPGQGLEAWAAMDDPLPGRRPGKRLESDMRKGPTAPGTELILGR